MFLDTLGVMVGGAHHDSTVAALEAARVLGGHAQASVVSYGDRTSVELAGFVNGVAAHALEYDDYTRKVTHLSASLVPGSLAVAEYVGAGGKTLLECYAIGFQVAAQIARGLGGGLFDRGWHAPSPLGAFANAAAASRLMGLDAMSTRMAFGITASEASGIRKNVGSMVQAFHMGHGARCGIFSTLLASRGFEADPDALEGDLSSVGHARFGLAETFNGPGNYDLALMGEGLGSHWELAHNNTVVRMHPGATALASAIDAMIDLAVMNDIKAEQVDRIILECTAQLNKVGSFKEATDGHKARFCLPYSMAVSLIDRKAGLSQYTDERVNRSDVQGLMKRVDVVVPDEFKNIVGPWTDTVNWGHTRLHIILKNGQRFFEERTSARGWPPHQPATWDDIASKYRDCCSGVISEAQIETSIELIRTLDTLQDLSPLFSALRSVR